MEKSQQNRKKVAGPKLILLWVVSVVIFMLMLSSVIGLFVKYRKIREHIKELKSEEASLQDKKETLNKTNKYIATPDGQEQIFRDKYRMVKPGEGIIVITNKETQEENLNKRPVLRRFWESIKRGLGLN